MRRIILLLYLIAISITPTIAQDEEPEGWPIIEHCVDEPTTPPDDWSFEGIIFFSSYFAIHALNHNLETPYIIAYADDVTSFSYRGAISPDGHLFSYPIGYSEATSMVSRRYVVEHIKTVRTDGSGEVSQVAWSWSTIGGGAYFVPETRWINNSEIVYPTTEGFQKVNPLLGEAELYPDEFYSFGDYSPDYSRIIAFTATQIEEQLIRTDTNEVLRDFEAYSYTDNIRVLSWRPDSQSVAISVDGALQLLNRDGQFESNIIEENVYVLDWNADSVNFAFVLDSTLYLGDRTAEQLTNTCLNVRYVAWSPNGKLAVSDGERISIIDFENITHYIVAYHEGSVFDWRIPSED